MLYITEKQEQVIDAVQEFIKCNKHIIVNDKDYSSSLLFQRVNGIITNYLKEKTGLNIEVHQYFDGRKLSKTKMEVLDMGNSNNGLGVYITFKRKKINTETVRVGEESTGVMKQWINGELIDITVVNTGLMNVETWDYSLSSSYDCISLT